MGCTLLFTEGDRRILEMFAERSDRLLEDLAEMAEIATTKRQREIMRHSLFGSSGAKKPYRNYFCASVNGDADREITKLVAMGLMERGAFINDGKEYYARVTEAGAAELGVSLPKD